MRPIGVQRSQSYGGGRPWFLRGHSAMIIIIIGHFLAILFSGKPKFYCYFLKQRKLFKSV